MMHLLTAMVFLAKIHLWDIEAITYLKWTDMSKDQNLEEYIQSVARDETIEPTNVRFQKMIGLDKRLDKVTALMIQDRLNKIRAKLRRQRANQDTLLILLMATKAYATKDIHNAEFWKNYCSEFTDDVTPPVNMLIKDSSHPKEFNPLTVPALSPINDQSVNDTLSSHDISFMMILAAAMGMGFLIHWSYRKCAKVLTGPF